MATIDSKEMVDKIIAANGELYPGEEPPVVKIVRYKNAWGKVTYGVVWEAENNDPDRYDHPTPFIFEPEIIWVRKV